MGSSVFLPGPVVNPFDQDLNSFDSPQFDNLTLTGDWTFNSTELIGQDDSLLGGVATCASFVLANLGVVPTDGDTITIGSVTYTFVDTLTGGNNEVSLTSGNADGVLIDLGYTINGVDLGVGKAPRNPEVIARVPQGQTGVTSLTLLSRVPGVAGDGIAISCSNPLLYAGLPGATSGGDNGSLFQYVSAEKGVFGVNPAEYLGQGSFPQTAIVNVRQTEQGDTALALYSPLLSALTFEIRNSAANIYFQRGGVQAPSMVIGPSTGGQPITYLSINDEDDKYIYAVGDTIELDPSVDLMINGTPGHTEEIDITGIGTLSVTKGIITGWTPA